MDSLTKAMVPAGMFDGVSKTAAAILAAGAFSPATQATLDSLTKAMVPAGMFDGVSKTAAAILGEGLSSARSAYFADLVNGALSEARAFPRVAPSAFADRFDVVQEALAGPLPGEAFVPATDEQRRIERLATQVVVTVLVCLVMADMYLTRRQTFDLIMNTIGTLGIVSGAGKTAGRIFNRLCGPDDASSTAFIPTDRTEPPTR